MKYLILPLCLFLAGCGCDKSCQGYYDNLRKVQVVATTPDGVTLYRVYDPKEGRFVYFSSRDTQTTEGCGKGCTRDVQTPSE